MLFVRALDKNRPRGAYAASARRPASSEVLANMMGPPRLQEASEAVDRVNHIHSLYRPSGKISDDDLLYTLGLFTLEPVRWIERYEWRSLTDAERCALATLWKTIGERLGIPYGRLPSHKRGWTDGLHWLDELAVWSSAYEMRNMRPSDDNERMAKANMEKAFGRYPSFLRHYRWKLASVWFGTRLRTAMR